MKFWNHLSRRGVGYLLYGVLTLFVLKMDSYFNMEEYKLAAFAGILVLGGAAFLAGLPKAKGLRPWQWDSCAVWTVLLAVSLLASQLLGVEGLNGWWGGNAYYMGTLFMLVCLCLYSVIRMGAGKGMVRWGIRLFLAAGLVADLLGIVNQYGWDPLGQTSRLIEKQRGVYFTTIGQMDFVALMMTMWLSLCVAGYVCAGGQKRTKEDIFRLVCAFFGFWGMMLFNSDGYLLGMMTMLAVLTCMKGFDTRQLERLCVIGGLFWCAAFIGVRLTAFWPTAQNLPMTAAAGQPVLSVCGVAASLGIVAALRRLHQKREPAALHRYSRILWGCALIVVVCAIVLATFVFPDVKLVGPLRHLRFNEKWGTHRGACWIALWRIFRNGGVLRWIFGWGMSSTHTLIAAQMYDWSDIEYDIFGFYAAHNEYLEQLIAGGILGLTAWIGFLLSNLLGGIRRAAADPIAASLTVAVAAYLGEAAINIRTCIVFPVFVVLLAMLSAQTAPEQPDEAQEREIWQEAAIVLIVLLVTGLLWQSIGGVIIPFEALN